MISDLEYHYEGSNTNSNNSGISIHAEGNEHCEMQLDALRAYTHSVSSTSASSSCEQQQFEIHQEQQYRQLHSIHGQQNYNSVSCNCENFQECLHDYAFEQQQQQQEPQYEVNQYSLVPQLQQQQQNSYISQFHEEQQIQQQQQQQYSCLQVVPILRHVKVPSVYILAGDIIVDLDTSIDSSAICSFSALNSYKNLTCIEFMKSCNSNEISLSQSTESLMQFTSIVDIMENTPDLFTHEFGMLLRQYQLFVSIQQSKAITFQHDVDYLTQIVPMLDEKYLTFLQESREFVTRRSRELNNSFHVYMVVKANTVSFMPDINRVGLSNDLSNLLGGSNEELSWMLMHYGLFEFFSKDTRNQFYFEFLSRQLLGDAKKPNSNSSNSINLVTLDGIEIEVKYTMETYFGENPESNVMFFYPHQLVMISFDIPQHSQRKISNARAAQQAKSSQNSFATSAAPTTVTSNTTTTHSMEFAAKIQRGNVINYSKNSQSFLETHYADRVRKITSAIPTVSATSSTMLYNQSFRGSGCGRQASEVVITNNASTKAIVNLAVVVPKQKRKYQKHPKSQHLIDFRKRNGTLLGVRSKQASLSNSSRAESALNRSKANSKELLNVNSSIGNGQPSNAAEITHTTLELIDSSLSSSSLDGEQIDQIHPSQFLSYASIQTLSQC